jgi:hypothetical protein
MWRIELAPTIQWRRCASTSMRSTNSDPRAMAEICADPMQILDGMSPHVWQGPTASEDWYGDVLTEGAHVGASGYHITLGEPRHVDVTGDNAYVVVPDGVANDGLSLGKRHLTQGGVVDPRDRR